MKPTALILLAMLSMSPLLAQEIETTAAGQVQIPIDVYNRLVEEGRDPTRLPRPAPALYALGNATVTLDATGPLPRGAGQVRVELIVQVFEDDWVLIPVLPVATPVEAATVGGTQVQLVSTPDGLAWATRKSGSYRMSLTYRVDAARSPSGFSLPVPLPRAASINLTAQLPGTGLDVSVIPAAGVRARESGGNTAVSATIPTTNGVQIAWREPTRQGHAVSRATYAGSLAGDAVTWIGVFDVELFSDESVTLELLPSKVTLNDLEVDGESAPILIEGDRFATLLKGRGAHRVKLGFQVPVVRSGGPPRIELDIPQVPVSRFDLTLPGKKEVTVTPATAVSSRQREGATVATVFAPMTRAIAFTWAEAVPEEIRTEVRANAGLYHAVHAEEGVLNVRALVLYELSRGETNIIRLSVPADVQVNRITAASGAVADWRIEGVAGDKPKEVTIFLDRKVRDQILLEVQYDRSLGGAVEGARIELPLLSAPQAHRQRGMAALLSSKDLTLEPLEDEGATRVGENQLPPFVRQGLEMTVAHTFKYVEAPPTLVVEAKAPERKQGKFDAQVDTLISLGEVTLSGSASVEIDLKAGRVMELRLEAPSGVNILNLTGPSIRDYQVTPGADGQLLDVQFTQEMEGQFRLDIAYERILVDGDADVVVPTIGVVGAEVEQGRIAVEALSAVEVQAAGTDQLTALDISELPRQLILRTTNPILLAYKYVQSDPPYRLALKVTRHQLLDVQEATIDRAAYRTLYTRDGLAVTIAQFDVRNSRKQFLRVRLPQEAEVWSAFVDGQPEQPALAENGDGDDSVNVLLKIVNSTSTFPVQLIYATPGAKIRRLGKAVGTLPRPDILVTESRWDVYLPAGMSYRKPASNMDLVGAGRPMAKGELREAMLKNEDGAAAQALEPLRITVPTAGVHFAFEKLYANQSEDDSRFSIAYASAAGANAGRLFSLLGALLVWVGIGLRLRPVTGLPARAPLGIGALGGIILVVTHGFYRVSAAPPMLLTMFVVVSTAALFAWRWYRDSREMETLR